MSTNRREKRYLLHRAKKGRLRKGETTMTYSDNIGIEYPYKWEARLSSFYNIVSGCLKNGFPVVVPKLWYEAWAFYPFFFIRRDLKVLDHIPILNHERIHIRQQRDIHLTISVPLIILFLLLELFAGFKPFLFLCIVPFIPTAFYGLEMIRSWHHLLIKKSIGDASEEKVTFHEVRENTCFEREAISHAPNAEYLFTRKFWAVLAYTGWKGFQNYGTK